MIENRQRAFVLHRRPYQENSQLVELLTEHHGRVSVVAKGIRTKKGGKAALLQPFLPVLVSWSGRSGLKSLRSIESNASICHFNGDFLYSGFYVNELLTRLLPVEAPVEGIFACYEAVLAAFEQQQDLPLTLRQFEWTLLEGMGYGVDCLHSQQQPINSDEYYRFDDELGWLPARMGDKEVIVGHIILAIAKGQWHSLDSQRVLKYMLRRQIQKLLGGRELKSRALFAANRGQK